ncbi:response regulator transcription factor [Terriglobus roseus]|uniref:Two-component system, OmpR family, response regulator PhoP n=1 Tax=Terriglobus roseus TaxID=392734 RepID=A0A1H4K3V9_9BACT|nr:response regulator transcription factor [Terriglobus roseus]SEB52795.1 two-component system, OmpR family, response regulator PhoP [Terriglobus roseus]
MRVLVVEDEVRLAENVARALREGPGYAVDVTHDGSKALELCIASQYDLVLLDLMLPGCSGDSVLSQLRAAKIGSSVLVLTAVIDTKRTVALLNSGADDFMTKPFDLGELIARCRALIRRSKETSASTLRFHNLEMHTGEYLLTCDEIPVELSPTGFRILEYLIRRPTMVVSKRELSENLYDFTWEQHSNVIEAHISNLRKRLRECTDVVTIETVRGRGYRLAES